ncbi:MAG: hypothetical protein AABZ36_09015 [Nitrospirota bacterium]
MEDQVTKLFLKEVARVFYFLVEEYSFSKPVIDVNNKINFITATFMGKNLAIECILDVREYDIDCKIARVINGKKTNHYAVDENRNKMREGIATLLRRRGIRERLFRKVSALEPNEIIKTTLEDFAEMLKKYGQEILSDSSKALD